MFNTKMSQLKQSTESNLNIMRPVWGIDRPTIMRPFDPTNFDDYVSESEDEFVQPFLQNQVLIGGKLRPVKVLKKIRRGLVTGLRTLTQITKTIAPFIALWPGSGPLWAIGLDLQATIIQNMLPKKGFRKHAREEAKLRQRTDKIKYRLMQNEGMSEQEAAKVISNVLTKLKYEKKSPNNQAIIKTIVDLKRKEAQNKLDENTAKLVMDLSKETGTPSGQIIDNQLRKLDEIKQSKILEHISDSVSGIKEGIREKASEIGSKAREFIGLDRDEQKEPDEIDALGILDVDLIQEMEEARRQLAIQNIELDQPSLNEFVDLKREERELKAKLSNIEAQKEREFEKKEMGNQEMMESIVSNINRLRRKEDKIKDELSDISSILGSSDDEEKQTELTPQEVHGLTAVTDTFMAKEARKNPNLYRDVLNVSKEILNNKPELAAYMTSDEFLRSPRFAEFLNRSGMFQSHPELFELIREDMSKYPQRLQRKLLPAIKKASWGVDPISLSESVEIQEDPFGLFGFTRVEEEKPKKRRKKSKTGTKKRKKRKAKDIKRGGGSWFIKRLLKSGTSVLRKGLKAVHMIAPLLALHKGFGPAWASALDLQASLIEDLLPKQTIKDLTRKEIKRNKQTKKLVQDLMKREGLTEKDAEKIVDSAYRKSQMKIKRPDAQDIIRTIAEIKAAEYKNELDRDTFQAAALLARRTGIPVEKILRNKLSKDIESINNSPARKEEVIKANEVPLEIIEIPKRPKPKSVLKLKQAPKLKPKKKRKRRKQKGVEGQSKLDINMFIPEGMQRRSSLLEPITEGREGGLLHRLRGGQVPKKRVLNLPPLEQTWEYNRLFNDIAGCGLFRCSDVKLGRYPKQAIGLEDLTGVPIELMCRYIDKQGGARRKPLKNWIKRPRHEQELSDIEEEEEKQMEIETPYEPDQEIETTSRRNPQNNSRQVLKTANLLSKLAGLNAPQRAAIGAAIGVTGIGISELAKYLRKRRKKRKRRKAKKRGGIKRVAVKKYVKLERHPDYKPSMTPGEKAAAVTLLASLLGTLGIGSRALYKALKKRKKKRGGGGDEKDDIPDAFERELAYMEERAKHAPIYLPDKFQPKPETYFGDFTTKDKLAFAGVLGLIATAVAKGIHSAVKSGKRKSKRRKHRKQKKGGAEEIELGTDPEQVLYNESISSAYRDDRNNLLRRNFGFTQPNIFEDVDLLPNIGGALVGGTKDIEMVRLDRDNQEEEEDPPLLEGKPTRRFEDIIARENPSFIGNIKKHPMLATTAVLTALSIGANLFRDYKRNKKRRKQRRKQKKGGYLEVQEFVDIVPNEKFSEVVACLNHLCKCRRRNRGKMRGVDRLISDKVLSRISKGGRSPEHIPYLLSHSEISDILKELSTGPKWLNNKPCVKISDKFRPLGIDIALSKKIEPIWNIGKVAKQRKPLNVQDRLVKLFGEKTAGLLMRRREKIGGKAIPKRELYKYLNKHR